MIFECECLHRLADDNPANHITRFTATRAQKFPWRGDWLDIVSEHEEAHRAGVPHSHLQAWPGGLVQTLIRDAVECSCHAASRASEIQMDYNGWLALKHSGRWDD